MHFYQSDATAPLQRPGGPGTQSRHGQGQAGVVTSGALQGHRSLRPLCRTGSQLRQKAEEGALSAAPAHLAERSDVYELSEQLPKMAFENWPRLGLNTSFPSHSYTQRDLLLPPPFTDEETGSVSKGTWPRAQGGEGQGWGLSPHLGGCVSRVQHHSRSQHFLLHRKVFDPLHWNSLRACFRNSDSWTPPCRS